MSLKPNISNKDVLRVTWKPETLNDATIMFKNKRKYTVCVLVMKNKIRKLFPEKCRYYLY